MKRKKYILGVMLHDGTEEHLRKQSVSGPATRVEHYYGRADIIDQYEALWRELSRIRSADAGDSKQATSLVAPGRVDTG